MMIGCSGSHTQFPIFLTGQCPFTYSAFETTDTVLRRKNACFFKEISLIVEWILRDITQMYVNRFVHGV